MIKLIDINSIFPHPDNPRKDLGDLTELTDSIMKVGILQNLTVVPRTKDTYTVIIGHRRLAAAKEAMLNAVPCVVSDIDLKEQLAVMLTENMQRNDLTIYEQAYGIQTMLDLGEDVNSIVDRTGFSESTVRRRMRLLSLDKDKLQAAELRGASLADYDKLNRIKDIELKNEVLESIGTNNFEWTLSRAVEKEKNQEKLLKLKEQLDTFAEEIECVGNEVYITSYNYNDSKKVEVPADASKRKYFYVVKAWAVTLYGEKTKEISAKEEKTALKRQKEEEKKRKYAEIAERAYQMRREFIKELNPKKCTDAVMKFALNSLVQNIGYNYTSISEEEFYENSGLDKLPKGKLFESFITGTDTASPEKLLAVAAYSAFHDDEKKDYLDYEGMYFKNKKLDIIYDFLEALGYECSDEERAWRNGTHILYAKKKGR